MSTIDSYEYVCDECGHIFKECEAYHSIQTIYDTKGYKLAAELPVTACPDCQSTNCNFRLVPSGGAPHNA